MLESQKESPLRPTGSEAQGGRQTTLSNGGEDLTVLLNQRCARVYHLAIALLGNEAEVIEVMQEVLQPLYEPATPFQSKLTGAMRLDALTVQAAIRRGRQGECSLDESMDTYLPTFDDTGHHRQRPLVDWSADLESLAASDEGQRLLRHAIVRLRPMEKASLVLRDLEAYSLEDISVMLGLSVSDVKRDLHHARLKLRGAIAAVLEPTPVA